jgi:amidohydrolase
MMNRHIDVQEILQLAKENFEFVKTIRRHLHQHPELSFQEFHTADFVEKQLHQIGLCSISRINTTGVTALLKDEDTECVGLRADLDALPISEIQNRDYRSLNEGVMHACGHDAHTAALLGAAKILHSLKDKIKGNIKFIFQPGEEVLPGGASLLIAAGVLENPRVKCMIGQHTTPEIQSGMMGIKPGAFMASTDEIHIQFIGKGGHAALPLTYRNPLMPAASFLNEVVALINEKGKTKNLPSVIAFGKIVANGATNVIPETLKLEGTFRAFDEEWRKEVHEIILDLAQKHAQKFETEVEVEIKRGYPALINDPDLSERVKNSLTKLLKEENVLALGIRMTAEDFSYYSQKIPSCFYRWGTGNREKGITAMNHTPQFDIDEESLVYGMAGLVVSALNELNHSFAQ